MFVLFLIILLIYFIFMILQIPLDHDDGSFKLVINDNKVISKTIITSEKKVFVDYTKKYTLRELLCDIYLTLEIVSTDLANYFYGQLCDVPIPVIGKIVVCPLSSKYDSFSNLKHDEIVTYHDLFKIIGLTAKKCKQTGREIYTLSDKKRICLQVIQNKLLFRYD